MKHGKDLSDFAQKWAEQLAARNAFEHSSCDLKGERLGENICCKWSSAGADYTGEMKWFSSIFKLLLKLIRNFKLCLFPHDNQITE